MANETDFAYAAGLIDGEGTIGIYKNKAKSCRCGYRFYLRVRLGMTNITAPYWLYTIFGGYFREYPNRGWGEKVLYEWGLSPEQAYAFLVSILPYLKTKKQQAQVAIEFQKDKYKGIRGRGRKTPQTILDAEEILASKIQGLNDKKGVHSIGE